MEGLLHMAGFILNNCVRPKEDACKVPIALRNAIPYLGPTRMRDKSSAHDLKSIRVKSVVNRFASHSLSLLLLLTLDHQLVSWPRWTLEWGALDSHSGLVKAFACNVSWLLAQETRPLFLLKLSLGARTPAVTGFRRN